MAPTGRKKTDRSELESFVLGLIWQLGPCSPYSLRRHMAQSPSTQWSGSAGAIYPLVARLEKQGLLASESGTTGRRERREYRITSAGKRALRAWIGPPLADAAISVSYDPLRSRARFLGLLTKDERRAWIDGAKRALDEVASRVDAWDREFARAASGQADPFAACLTASGRIDVAGRRKWLMHVARASDAAG